LTAEEWADGIIEREGLKERGLLIKYSVIDPSTFIASGGPSIAERLSMRKLHFSKADNKRVAQRGAMGGWDQLRARLKGGEDGRPMIYFFNTCKDLIRTLPALQHDADHLEDLDTEGEDHSADTARYAAMSRPWIPRTNVVRLPVHAWTAGADGIIRSGLSIREMIDRQARRNRRAGR
jgi:hypothetical protein